METNDSKEVPFAVTADVSSYGTSYSTEGVDEEKVFSTEEGQVEHDEQMWLYQPTDRQSGGKTSPLASKNSKKKLGWRGLLLAIVSGLALIVLVYFGCAPSTSRKGILSGDPFLARGSWHPQPTTPVVKAMEQENQEDNIINELMPLFEALGDQVYGAPENNDDDSVDDSDDDDDDDDWDNDNDAVSDQYQPTKKKLSKKEKKRLKKKLKKLRKQRKKQKKLNELNRNDEKNGDNDEPADTSKRESGPVQDLATIQVEELFDKDIDALGQFFNYPEGQARIEASMVTIPPGASTDIHIHPVPFFFTVLQGTLTVFYGSKGLRIYHPGDSEVDAYEWEHQGFNFGQEPVRVLCVFAGADGVESTVEKQHFNRKLLSGKY